MSSSSSPVIKPPTTPVPPLEQTERSGGGGGKSQGGIGQKGEEEYPTQDVNFSKMVSAFVFAMDAVRHKNKEDEAVARSIASNQRKGMTKDDDLATGKEESRVLASTRSRTSGHRASASASATAESLSKLSSVTDSQYIQKAPEQYNQVEISLRLFSESVASCVRLEMGRYRLDRRLAVYTQPRFMRVEGGDWLVPTHLDLYTNFETALAFYIHPVIYKAIKSQFLEIHKEPRLEHITLQQLIFLLPVKQNQASGSSMAPSATQTEKERSNSAVACLKEMFHDLVVAYLKTILPAHQRNEPEVRRNKKEYIDSLLKWRTPIRIC